MVHDVICSAVAPSEAPARMNCRASEVDKAVDLLCDLPIWADPATEIELREVTLPREVRTVRLYDAANDTVIGLLERTNDRLFTAFEVADVLSWHIEYRDRLWASTKVRSLKDEVLELSIDLAAMRR